MAAPRNAKDIAYPWLKTDHEQKRSPIIKQQEKKRIKNTFEYVPLQGKESHTRPPENRSFAPEATGMMLVKSAIASAPGRQCHKMSLPSTPCRIKQNREKETDSGFRAKRGRGTQGETHNVRRTREAQSKATQRHNSRLAATHFDQGRRISSLGLENGEAR
jgi:hypothetical protein